MTPRRYLSTKAILAAWYVAFIAIVVIGVVIGLGGWYGVALLALPVVIILLAKALVVLMEEFL